jgi:hypothetical protein
LQGAITHPLTATSRTQRRGPDGRPTAELAARFIKANDRLTALERLEIYNRMYWYRILDCFHDDCPGCARRSVTAVRAAGERIWRKPRSRSRCEISGTAGEFIRAEPQWRRRARAGGRHRAL